jgi:hypothetical protein
MLERISTSQLLLLEINWSEPHTLGAFDPFIKPTLSILKSEHKGIRINFLTVCTTPAGKLVHHGSMVTAWPGLPLQEDTITSGNYSMATRVDSVLVTNDVGPRVSIGSNEGLVCLYNLPSYHCWCVTGRSCPLTVPFVGRTFPTANWPRLRSYLL